MELTFTKMNGLGNDFVFIEDLDSTLDLAPEAVAWLCDRHFGIGGDGVILVRPAQDPGADYYMHYFNADGSLAEMCGNGARCFAKYLVDHSLIAAGTESLVIETLGGLKPVTFTRDYDSSLHTATVDMGIPELDPAKLPSTFDGTQVYQCPVETPYGTFAVTGVSMGNPHAIIWVDDVNEAPVETVGSFIEQSDYFPKGTNVEFAQLIDNETISLRVWERGVGETLACGTGACATLVAGTLSCFTGRHATIELPGGELFIRWHEDDHVYMTGSASEVFSGTIVIPEEDDDADL
ncbi:MAG: diaminopimelate epimerase [Coriobacteriia bacterium]|nr:diaminopimelate epimerase [Coriobacteriia bacterium]MBN2821846.1 diaminopimelate epimerase [Coriobacteriia bacterium]